MDAICFTASTTPASTPPIIPSPPPDAAATAAAPPSRPIVLAAAMLYCCCPPPLARFRSTTSRPPRKAAGPVCWACLPRATRHAVPPTTEGPAPPPAALCVCACVGDGVWWGQGMGNQKKRATHACDLLSLLPSHYPPSHRWHAIRFGRDLRGRAVMHLNNWDGIESRSIEGFQGPAGPEHAPRWVVEGIQERPPPPAQDDGCSRYFAENAAPRRRRHDARQPRPNAQA